MNVGEEKQEQEDAQTDGFKNVDSVKSIKVGCIHKVVNLDPLTVAAKEDNCEIKITHKDGTTQTHKVKKGGGFEKRDGFIIVFVDPVYKVD